MSRRLLPALLALLLAAASAAVVSTSARAHDRGRYQVCVVTNTGTWLRRCHGCREWVHKGRAFRVEWQFRWDLGVWNRESRGRLDLRTVTLAHTSYCRAAGI